MSDAPDDGTSPFGSLIEMFPHLGTPAEEVPLADVHVRALAFEDGPSLTLAFVIWKLPTSPAVLRRELGQRIEGALLALLSRSADDVLAEGERRPSRIRVLFFDSPSAESEAALAPFGLAKVPYDAVAMAATMSHVRGEALRCGTTAPDEPSAVYEVEVAPPAAERGAVLASVELALREAVTGTVWGEQPGSFFRALSGVLAARGEAPLPATTESIDRLELLAGQFVPARVRWIPPAVFQALCDVVGVVASREFGRKVDWAASEPEEDGFAPPPLLRAKLPDGVVHIPIAEHLLRWSMMPLAEGELPPPLADWVADQFGDRATSS